MQNQKKLLLIINPCAGQRKAKKYLCDIINLFNRAGFSVLVHITADSGDAETAAMRYASQIDLVVCCGGDGTFNETLSGILKSSADLPIGYIPAGSTNDFASSFQLSSNPLQAARDIIDGKPMPLDVGLFAERYFSYIASFGAFTKTSYSTPQELKNLLGHAAYVLNGIQELSQLKSYPLRFELPNETLEESKYIFGAISNSTSVGGILTLAKDKVDLCDGKLELLLIRAPRNIGELSECVQALNRQDYNCGMLTFRSIEWAKVTAPAEMAWTLDGEREKGHSLIEIKCLPHAARIYRNRSI